MCKGKSWGAGAGGMLSAKCVCVPLADTHLPRGTAVAKASQP